MLVIPTYFITHEESYSLHPVPRGFSSSCFWFVHNIVGDEERTLKKLRTPSNNKGSSIDIKPLDYSFLRCSSHTEDAAYAM